MNDDRCPHCGGAMMPVLLRASTEPEPGPLCHDAPVRLECPSCPDPLSSTSGADGEGSPAPD